MLKNAWPVTVLVEMAKNVIILGANGMLGSSLFRYLTNHSNVNVYGLVRRSHLQSSSAFKGKNNIIQGTGIEELTRLAEIIKSLRPSWVVNCIGLIKQNKEALSTLQQLEVNGVFPHKLANICDNLNTKLIHFSTDCVFSGARGKYLEDDIPDAQDLYGRTKFLGEVAYGGHITFRTSIIGHELNSSLSLIDWFLSQEGTVKGYENAKFSGLPTVCIAQFLDEYVFRNNKLSGLFNLSSTPIDKYSLLSLVKTIYQKSIKIEKCPKLVIDRSLDSTKLNSATGFKADNWQNLIQKMHNEYEENFC